MECGNRRTKPERLRFRTNPPLERCQAITAVGLEAQGDDTDSDESGDEEEEDERSRQQISSQETPQEFDIMDLVSGPATFSNDELEGIFDQEIKFVGPGQEFDISTPEPTNNDSREDPEMALICALRIDIHERQDFYQEKWAENLHAARTRASPQPAQLPQNSHCSWKQHPLIDPLSPSTLPSIVVTDAEGNIYTLEECASVLDENSYRNIAARNAWQSQKEILLGEEEESGEEYAKRLRHLADWEVEFRRVDDGWVKREREEQAKAREEEIVILKEMVEENEMTEPDSMTKLEDAREGHDKEPEEIQTSKGEVDESETLEPNSKARDDIEYFDNCLKESLWWAKNEFIETYRWASAQEEKA